MMNIITHQFHLDALPASDLKEYLDRCYRTLCEDGMGPVFVIVEKNDDIAGLDFAFIGNRGLLSDLYEERAPKEDGFTRPYHWVSYLPGLQLFVAMYLVNGEDCYWIMIPEAIVDANHELHWILTSDEQGGLSPPQPL